MVIILMISAALFFAWFFYQRAKNIDLNLRNGHFMRVARAAIALWAGVEAWQTGQWLLLFPATILAMQAIFNVGCCGAASCAVPPVRSNASVAKDDITFEEIK